jgi:DNA recombination protein RmuC
MIFLLIALFLATAGLTAAVARQAARARAAEAARQAADQARHEAELRVGAERDAREREREHHQQLVAELQRATEEKLKLVAGNREEFTREMRSISAGVLKDTTEQVTRLADQARRAEREAAAGELKARAEEIKQAVAPITEHLRTVQEKVAVLDKEHKGAAAGVGQMVRSVADELAKLRAETGTLVSALKRPQVRGAWGEMALHSCAKAANMIPHIDFHDQRTIGDEATGRLRPDMTVHLPSEAEVVVDSKVPLDAYLAALEAQDETLRDAEIDRHARQVRSHIDKLASKAYHAAVGGSPEFVVCFLPNEAVYCAALDRDPGLLQYGAGKGVLLATPSTLIALLHACAYAWRQETIAESAREIADAARELHRRVGTFLEPFSRLGRQLGSAITAYNEAVGSMDARVLPQLRRIETAGAGSEKQLAEVRPLDTPPRLLTAPEAPPAEDEPARRLPPAA